MPAKPAVNLSVAAEEKNLDCGPGCRCTSACGNPLKEKGAEGLQELIDAIVADGGLVEDISLLCQTDTHTGSINWSFHYAAPHPLCLTWQGWYRDSQSDCRWDWWRTFIHQQSFMELNLLQAHAGIGVGSPPTELRTRTWCCNSGGSSGCRLQLYLPHRWAWPRNGDIWTTLALSSCSQSLERQYWLCAAGCYRWNLIFHATSVSAFSSV